MKNTPVISKRNKATTYQPMFVGCVLYFLLFWLPVSMGQSLFAQKNANRALIETLRKNISNGNPIALRDLGKIYDKQPQNSEVKSILYQYTLFTHKEWDQKTSFLSFYYKNEEALRFSELLKVFYLTPIEQRSSDFQITDRGSKNMPIAKIQLYIQRMAAFLQKKDAKGLLDEIDKIGSINNPSVTDILSTIVTQNAVLQLPPKDKEQVISKLLSYIPDSIAFTRVLLLTEKKALPLSYCQRQLALLSNNYFETDSHEALLQDYQKLIESFSYNLTAIKKYGFQKENFTPAKFFREKADYYGWILANCTDSLFWVQRNALLDLFQTNHPRVLFYAAGIQYRIWRSGKTDHSYYDLLNKHIDVVVSFDRNQPFDQIPPTPQAQLNFIIYWSIHYDQYEWDDFQKIFINREFLSSKVDDYDRLFRRLNSTNDSIARLSFLALCQGKPSEIQRLLNKFKPLLRNYNGSIPPLKYKLLEQLSLLTYFCRQNNIAYLPPPHLKSKLKALEQILPPKDRIRLEADLIESVHLEELTILEYYASTRARNLDLNYSIGRVLDYLYNKNWEAIIYNENEFRFYLLKAQLFGNLGGFGSCKRYMERIKLENPVSYNLLKRLEKLESNQTISSSISFLLEQKEKNNPENFLMSFLATPEDFSDEEIKKIPPYQSEEFPTIIQFLFEQKNRKVINKIEKYISLHTTLKMVPLIFKTPQKRWSNNLQAGKAMVKILNQLYRFPLTGKTQKNIEQWWELWRTRPEDYLNWGETLFRQQLVYNDSMTNLTIDDLNRITESVHYIPLYREKCLKDLSKVKKNRSVYQLKINPKLSVEKELSYLKTIPFGHKELANIPRIFRIDNATLLFNYIYERALSFNPKDQSTLFNDLFRQSWFIDLVTSGETDPKKTEHIRAILTGYLAESTFLTEFEEKNTLLNIAHLKNVSLSLKQKLRLLTKDSINETIRYDYLKIILSRLEFHEIIIVFPILKDLEFLGENSFDFLSRDFGLPIFGFSTYNEEEKFLAQLKSHTEYELYLDQLAQFGLPLLTPEGDLDLLQIYQLLEKDLIVPFLGEGGKYRDYYIYGLVKLLELHFKTTLGFHNKINENQTFYTYNSLKRVDTWKEWLIENHLPESTFFYNR